MHHEELTWLRTKKWTYDAENIFINILYYGILMIFLAFAVYAYRPKLYQPRSKRKRIFLHVKSVTSSGLSLYSSTGFTLFIITSSFSSVSLSHIIFFKLCNWLFIMKIYYSRGSEFIRRPCPYPTVPYRFTRGTV